MNADPLTRGGAGAETHAEEDRKRREGVELRNEADNLVFRTEKLIAENGDKITVLKLNVDENPNLAMEYQITSIPAMKVFNKGQVEKTIIGAKPKFALEQDLAEFLG